MDDVVIAPRRKFSHAFKREAVARVLEKGEFQKDVCADLDLKSSVLARWIKQVRTADERKKKHKRTTWTSLPAPIEQHEPTAPAAQTAHLEAEITKLRARVEQLTQEAERWKLEAEKAAEELDLLKKPLAHYLRK